MSKTASVMWKNVAMKNHAAWQERKSNLCGKRTGVALAIWEIAPMKR
jgi:hypothetical protein